MLEAYVKVGKWYQENIIGKRTYIIALILAVLNLLQAFNVVTLSGSQMDVINMLLGAAGLGTLRSAVK